MKFRTIRVSGMLATAIAIALAGTVEASAQTANVAGAWTLTVDSDAGITTPSVTLVQDGETLTGHYSSENLGENDLTGTVSGSDIRFSFTADLGGMDIEVSYAGTIDEDGMISGTLDLGGFGGGTFTAVRKEA